MDIVTNKEFKAMLLQVGEELYRSMPWREDTRPYFILVSELMLQQTQVGRVIPKFNAFINDFPDIESLARSDLANVVRSWQGLGYNRRAKYLHEAAKMVVAMGDFPKTESALTKLPGVGKNTAGAILAYSYNKPTIFVETNIRTVYIHHFFNDQFAVDDGQIIQKLEETIDTAHPREFYWALMDYGSWLKANGVKNNHRSKQYKKQSPLAGSVREIRGQIIALLADRDRALDELKLHVQVDERFQPALEGLLRDGLVKQTKQKFHLTK